MSSNDLWINVLGMLSAQISEQNFYTWIKTIEFLGWDGEYLQLAVPSKFMKDIVEERYLAQIQATVEQLESAPCRVRLVIDKDAATRNEAQSDNDSSTPEGETRDTLPLKPRNSLPPSAIKEVPVANDSLSPQYNFDAFVVGSSNQFAHAAALAVAQVPGITYNPLFLYGGVGLGKTHLIQAIGNMISKTKQNARVVYNDSEKFTNELINALKNGKIEDFRQRYRHVDVLIIDDIQFIAGKERTQEEFFHTFNTLHREKKQIVISSDKFPREITNLEERLRSRFEWGLIADIQPPDLETKLAILRKKAESEGVNLPNDAALYIAKAIKNNIRELEGCLIRVSAYSKLTGVDLSLDLIKLMLKDIVRDIDKIISCDEIQREVGNFFHVKVNDMKSKSRSSEYITARHTAMYLCRKLTNMSLPQIGREFGGRDHSTVVHAIKTIDKRIISDETFSNDLQAIEARILS